MLSSPVQQWGLLAWNRRWLIHDPSSGTASLFRDSDTGTAPVVTFDFGSDSTVEPQPDSPNELSVDNGVAIIHLKFDDEPTCAAFLGAFSAAAAAAAAVRVPFHDPARFPERLGKYWLGPIDPLRPHDDPHGGYGLVKAGIDSETGERVCCKLSVIPAGAAAAAAAAATATPTRDDDLKRKEIVLHAGLKHPNIVELKDVVDAQPAGRQAKELCMIMELMEGGELYAEVVTHGGLSEELARFYFRQVLMGVCYCHGRKLVHRDIKLENLLLSRDRQVVKIADFGHGKDVSTTAAKTLIATEKYVAPEALEGGEYDGYKVDMWSCGVVLYCMTECRFPFTKAGNHGCGGPDCYTRTPGNLELMRHLQAASYPLKPERSAEYRSFLSRLLCVDVARRYTAAEALKDPWILGDDWSPDSVAAMLSEMDTTSVVVATGFEPEAWLARVRRVMSGEEGKEEGEDAAGSEEEPMECEEDDQF